jgi:outer membrane protein assembly factor BamA
MKTQNHIHSLLLSSDPVDGGAPLEPTGSVALPSSGVLDEDVSGVDTSYPLLSAGLYDFRIEEVSEEPNKAKTGTNLKIVVVTTKEAMSVKREALAPGLKLTQYIGLTPTEKYSTDAIKRNVAAFVQAVGSGIKSVRPFEQFKDKLVRAKVVINPAEGQYEASNGLKWVPVE